MHTRPRKLVLVAHVASSVGWLGAVLTFLVVSIIGVTTDNEQVARGAYLVMDRAAWYVLVPLATATLITGIAGALGTPWGLFRHYWVLIKLVVAAMATTLLVMYMPTFAAMAGVAADQGAGLPDIRNPSPALHAMLALAGLVVATALAVYKPRGRTPWGQRRSG